MKQIIIVNESLKLPRGKLAAQVAHAAVAAFLEAGDKAKRIWLAEGMPKVVLRSETADDVMRFAEAARKHGIPSYLVCDAGRTVVPAGTVTCLGLGPASENELDEITGELKLVR